MAHKDANGSFKDTLRGERDKLQRDMEQLRQEIVEREASLRAKETRLEHILALLDDEPKKPAQQLRKAKESPGRSTPSAQLLDMAVEVLRGQKSEPMHYRDLADELMRRGAVIRGKDPAASLVARMTQDDNRRAESERRFVRPVSKGFYALREDYTNARNVGAKRRRRTTSESNNDEVK